MRCNNAVQKSPVAWEAFELGKRAGLFFASEAQANCKGLPAQPIETLEFSVRSQYPLNLFGGNEYRSPNGDVPLGILPAVSGVDSWRRRNPPSIPDFGASGLRPASEFFRSWIAECHG